MDLKLIAFDSRIVPYIHYDKEGESNGEGNPPALVNLEEDCREVGELREEGEASEDNDKDPVAPPHQKHDRYHEECGHEHDNHDCSS